MTAAIDRKLRVFLCHSSQDKPIARELYQRLNAEGWIDPWLDEEKLFPGQDWDMEIKKSVENSDVVVVCLSNNSVSKEGYVQKEIKLALNVALEKPDSTIFIIPLRIDDCIVPEKIQTWQWIDYFPANNQLHAFRRILWSLSSRAESLQIQNRINLIYSFGGMDFFKIPKGKFLMGSSDADKNARDDEKPQHEVNISYDYWIGRCPITNDQYSVFAKATGRIINLSSDKASCPVSIVSPYDARAFIVWLNDNCQASLPEGLVFRLPSESEWEKAARGIDGRIYPWGNLFNQNLCNTSESNKGGTSHVGAYSPLGDSPYGVTDMAGNVWEWTRTIYRPYPYKSDDGRESESLSDVNLLVIRGGSWNRDGVYARAASRYYYPPDPWGRHGLRVVIVPSA